MKKYFSKNILFLLLFLTLSNFLHAQLHIDSLLTKLGDSYPQEKIYLHLDKGYYNAGETIWFKAYISTDNLSVALSKTLYVELIDDKGDILQKKIMPVYESGAASNFDLPDTISNGRLFIRAYTSWMLNFDSSLLYLKALQIITTSKVAKKIPAPVVFSLTLFPEAGDMVENITSRVAFKANDQDGIPINVSGNIVNEAGKKITAFSSVHDGMGYFFITPLPGEKYKAIWKDKKGLQHETALPDAKKQAVGLSVSTSTDTINYTLRRSDNAEENFTSYTVIAQMQQQIVYSAKINMKVKKEVTAPIITENFTDGVLQLTIFNAAQIPVAERLIFINHNNYFFTTDLHVVEKNITKHGHNTLQIDVSDTLLTNLSISVTDAGINPITNNEENIFSSLLLSSDLKGYVYNPAYYFSNDNDSVKQHLDLVMMTNGWRRFKWENILAQRWPQLIWPIDNYLSIKGNIYGLTKPQLAGKDLTGFIKTKNNSSNFITIPLNTDGQFRVTGIYLFDTARLYYQINNDKDKRLTSSASFSFKNEIASASTASVNLLSSLFYSLKLDSSYLQKNAKLAALQRSFLESNKTKTLDVVKVIGKTKTLKQKLEEQYTSGFFSGADGYTFTMEDDPFAKSASSVLDYLRGKVAGLQIDPTGTSATWRGSQTSIFLNETTTDISMLQSVSMSDVALIKVLRPPFFGATGGGAGGAIAIYTKKGGDNSAVKGLDFTLIYGYSAIKEFYMPDYEKTNDTNLPDYRTTLYWNPFLILDKKNRRIKIPFYNSDNCKKIRVVIEGINKTGQFTSEEKIFE
ncbi:MAG: hypothetical protein RIS73_242 [Bacteroidota bacterium]